MDNETIGKRLQSARESLGSTQEQVAKYVETNRETISYIETGTRPVNTMMLYRLADLYGYKMSYFVDEVEEEDKPYVSMAFRISDLNDNDLRIIAQVNRMAFNLDNLYRLLGEQ